MNEFRFPLYIFFPLFLGRIIDAKAEKNRGIECKKKKKSKEKTKSKIYHYPRTVFPLK